MLTFEYICLNISNTYNQNCMKIKQANLICMNCGFEVYISTFWAKQGGNLKCPACGSPNSWRKIPYVGTDKKIELLRQKELWKKLIIAQNPSQFREGKWKVAKGWKKYLDWIEEMEASGKKKKGIAALREFVEGDSKNKFDIMRKFKDE